MSLLSEERRIAVIAGMFGLGILFQFLGCFLWGNWWPLLTAFAYLFVPMSYLFFGGSSDGSNLASGWVDVGKFLTGFAAIGTIAIPSILYHAGKITSGALVMEILAVVLMGTSLILYDIMSEREGTGGFYSS